MESLGTRKCGVAGCTRAHNARGFCSMHYKRNLRGAPGEPSPRYSRHGLSGTRTYAIWQGMLQRCNNPLDSSYLRYGGAGVTVCPRWRRFAAFYADMGTAPPGMSLDRVDGAKGYEPGNCRWATPSGQAINRRSKPSKSGWMGVFAHHGSWFGRVVVDKRSFLTPAMQTSDEAAWMRDQWALALHGEYARLNFNYVEVGDATK